ncbi:MAG: cysteine desulfurase, partial [Treponema sp.]|nr:cysteine desulfurase [Treponema sp.]
PGIPGQVMERGLSQKGFCISTGSACSSQSKARPVLDSLHISPAEKEAAVRFSFGFSTTKEAMEDLVKALREVCANFE